MNLSIHHCRHAACAIAAVLAAGCLPLSGVLRADDREDDGDDGGKRERPWRKGGDRDGRGGDRDGRGWIGEMMDSLTESEKAELRAAMDSVWHDKEVLAAREEMHRASEAYREALRKSMENTNPKVREILTKMLEAPTPAPRKDDDKREPSFFKSLTDEERAILRQAKEKADQSEAVKAAVVKKDAATDGETKIAALRELRAALHKAMIEADPRVAEILGKLPVPGKRDGSRGDRGGKGERNGDGRPRRSGDGDGDRDGVPGRGRPDPSDGSDDDRSAPPCD